jgi:hypothetical protein
MFLALRGVKIPEYRPPSETSTTTPGSERGDDPDA